MARVKFFQCQQGGHKDLRREITDIDAPRLWFGFSRLRQMKIIKMLNVGLIVGEHYHPKHGKKSRTEVFIAIDGEGAISAHPVLFILRYKYPGTDKIIEKELRAGYGCRIPPGVTHSFYSAKENAMLWGLSNKPFMIEDAIPDKLF